MTKTFNTEKSMDSLYTISVSDVDSNTSVDVHRNMDTQSSAEQCGNRELGGKVGTVVHTYMPIRTDIATPNALHDSCTVMDTVIMTHMHTDGDDAATLAATQGAKGKSVETCALKLTPTTTSPATDDTVVASSKHADGDEKCSVMGSEENVDELAHTQHLTRESMCVDSSSTDAIDEIFAVFENRAVAATNTIATTVATPIDCGVEHVELIVSPKLSVNQRIGLCETKFEGDRVEGIIVNEEEAIQTEPALNNTLTADTRKCVRDIVVEHTIPVNSEGNRADGGTVSGGEDSHVERTLDYTETAGTRTCVCDTVVVLTIPVNSEGDRADGCTVNVGVNTHGHQTEKSLDSAEILGTGACMRDGAAEHTALVKSDGCRADKGTVFGAQTALGTTDTVVCRDSASCIFETTGPADGAIIAQEVAANSSGTPDTDDTGISAVSTNTVVQAVVTGSGCITGIHNTVVDVGISPSIVGDADIVSDPAIPTDSKVTSTVFDNSNVAFATADNAAIAVPVDTEVTAVIADMAATADTTVVAVPVKSAISPETVPVESQISPVSADMNPTFNSSTAAVPVDTKVTAMVADIADMADSVAVAVPVESQISHVSADMNPTFNSSTAAVPVDTKVTAMVADIADMADSVAVAVPVESQISPVSADMNSADSPATTTVPVDTEVTAVVADIADMADSVAVAVPVESQISPVSADMNPTAKSSTAAVPVDTEVTAGVADIAAMADTGAVAVPVESETNPARTDMNPTANSATAALPVDTEVIAVAADIVTVADSAVIAVSIDTKDISVVADMNTVPVPGIGVTAMGADMIAASNTTAVTAPVDTQITIVGTDMIAMTDTFGANGVAKGGTSVDPVEAVLVSGTSVGMISSDFVTTTTGSGLPTLRGGTYDAAATVETAVSAVAVGTESSAELSGTDNIMGSAVGTDKADSALSIDADTAGGSVKASVVDVKVLKNDTAVSAGIGVTGDTALVAHTDENDTTGMAYSAKGTADTLIDSVAAEQHACPCTAEYTHPVDTVSSVSTANATASGVKAGTIGTNNAIAEDVAVEAVSIADTTTIASTVDTVHIVAAAYIYSTADDADADGLINSVAIGKTVEPSTVIVDAAAIGVPANPVVVAGTVDTVHTALVADTGSATAVVNDGDVINSVVTAETEVKTISELVVDCTDDSNIDTGMLHSVRTVRAAVCGSPVDSVEANALANTVVATRTNKDSKANETAAIDRADDAMVEAGIIDAVQVTAAADTGTTAEVDDVGDIIDTDVNAKMDGISGADTSAGIDGTIHTIIIDGTADTVVKAEAISTLAVNDTTADAAGNRIAAATAGNSVSDVTTNGTAIISIVKTIDIALTADSNSIGVVAGTNEITDAVVNASHDETIDTGVSAVHGKPANTATMVDYDTNAVSSGSVSGSAGNDDANVSVNISQTVSTTTAARTGDNAATIDIVNINLTKSTISAEPVADITPSIVAKTITSSTTDGTLTSDTADTIPPSALVETNATDDMSDTPGTVNTIISAQGGTTVAISATADSETVATADSVETTDITGTVDTVIDARANETVAIATNAKTEAVAIDANAESESVGVNSDIDCARAVDTADITATSDSEIGIIAATANPESVGIDSDILIIDDSTDADNTDIAADTGGLVITADTATTALPGTEETEQTEALGRDGAEAHGNKDESAEEETEGSAERDNIREAERGAKQTMDAKVASNVSIEVAHECAADSGPMVATATSNQDYRNAEDSSLMVADPITDSGQAALQGNKHSATADINTSGITSRTDAYSSDKRICTSIDTDTESAAVVTRTYAQFASIRSELEHVRQQATLAAQERNQLRLLVGTLAHELEALREAVHGDVRMYGKLNKGILGANMNSVAAQEASDGNTETQPGVGRFEDRLVSTDRIPTCAESIIDKPESNTFQPKRVTGNRKRKATLSTEPATKRRSVSNDTHMGSESCAVSYKRGSELQPQIPPPTRTSGQITQCGLGAIQVHMEGHTHVMAEDTGEHNKTTADTANTLMTVKMRKRLARGGACKRLPGVVYDGDEVEDTETASTARKDRQVHRREEKGHRSGKHTHNPSARKSGHSAKVKRSRRGNSSTKAVQRSMQTRKRDASNESDEEEGESMVDVADMDSIPAEPQSSSRQKKNSRSRGGSGAKKGRKGKGSAHELVPERQGLPKTLQTTLSRGEVIDDSESGDESRSQEVPLAARRKKTIVHFGWPDVPAYEALKSKGRTVRGVSRNPSESVGANGGGRESRAGEEARWHSFEGKEGRRTADTVRDAPTHYHGRAPSVVEKMLLKETVTTESNSTEAGSAGTEVGDMSEVERSDMELSIGRGTGKTTSTRVRASRRLRGDGDEDMTHNKNFAFRTPPKVSKRKHSKNDHGTRGNTRNTHSADRGARSKISFTNDLSSEGDTNVKAAYANRENVCPASDRKKRKISKVNTLLERDSAPRVLKSVGQRFNV
ncbi:hypothetical protein SARC_06549 [Sphaeroforma arctica JP610]|uniref:Uncharacterized protein n=1 Tax=Sphaeroforma arctica JP610 TaxID=667725 RepID=A0A0L0FWX3_9EUKA|nr:hypothetical protein SARC_06549 [Sphaeroforma arctica JP610]KNC81124.1 hypothetical protein SARC_06549 [Sphaeroforma arctica JP610]|eukprot:XP_014155026.1 hypothetical protein SARC_06549 [Sphaeroforma arctica JP610]